MKEIIQVCQNMKVWKKFYKFAKICKYGRNYTSLLKYESMEEIIQVC